MTFIEYLNTFPMNISQRYNAKKLVKFGNSRHVRIVYTPHAREIVQILAAHGVQISIDRVFECASSNEWLEVVS